MNEIIIACTNNASQKAYPLGTTLAEIIEDQNIELASPILGALVNNELRELQYAIYKPKSVQFIDYSHPFGKQMYIRSLTMVLYKAVNDLYPHVGFKVEHSISKGLYCELQGPALDLETHLQIIQSLRFRMAEIIQADYSFEREEIETIEAIKVFEDLGLQDKVKLLKTRNQAFTSLYKLEGVLDYYYGHLVPSTGYLKQFDLVKYYQGMLLIFPKSNHPDELEDIVIQSKMFEIFQEHKDWVDILEVPTVGHLNELVTNRKVGQIIKVAEALHEKKLALIADLIHARKPEVKIVLVSGPSSSGKTTFTKRLDIQLRVLGYKPVQISLDNYFVEREKTPRDEHGEFDFESPNALDIPLFNQHMNELIQGKPVLMPRFSFTTGSRYFAEEPLVLPENGLILIEGIHALNPELTSFIDRTQTYKVYVSALTQLNIDRHNRIPTTDNRLIRRMVRDSFYRGYSAIQTIDRWPSVRRGEDKHIFPYQEQADVMFNTALVFELGILKVYAQPLLEAVPRNIPAWAEAKRLLKFLSYFVPIHTTELPPTSILREFLEGSSFDYDG